MHDAGTTPLNVTVVLCVADANCVFINNIIPKLMPLMRIVCDIFNHGALLTTSVL